MDRSRYADHPFGEIRRTPGNFGYDAFFPAPLPRRLALEPETMAVVADAEAALGRLDGISQLLPSVALLARPAVLREAVASTQIEGTQATIREVYDAHASDGVLSPDLEEVVGTIHATEFAVQRLAELPMSMRLVREAHAICLDGSRGRDKRPGELRTSQNWIGRAGSTIETASYVPPPPDAMNAALDDWERFVNESQLGMPVVAQCALAHYQFEAIHPFLDGNGRLGRIIIALFLQTHGRLGQPVLAISPYLEARRDIYIAHLQAVHETGAVDPWVRFFAEAVVAEATSGADRARRLMALRERYRRTVSGNSNAQLLVDVLFEHPVLTGRLVEGRLKVTRPTALRLLSEFAEAGVLTERPPGPRSQRSWAAHEALDVFAPR